MNGSNKGNGKGKLKKILVLFLAVFLLINNSISVFAGGSWVDKSSDGYQELYGVNADMSNDVSPSEVNDYIPTQESAVLELIGGALYVLAKGANAILKGAGIDLSIDGIVYGRTSDNEIMMDIARFGLEPGNPWGLFAASVYYNLRVLSLFAAPLIIVVLLIVQLVKGELKTDKGRSQLKTVIQNSVLYLLLLYTMPYIAQLFLFFRDGFMVICSDGLSSALSNMGINNSDLVFTVGEVDVQIRGANGIYEALEAAYESYPSFETAVALFATVLAGWFYLWDYLKIALIVAITFGLFPLFVLLYMWDPKKLLLWLDIFFPSLMIPFIDMLILTVPAFIIASFKMVFGQNGWFTTNDGALALCIILVAVIWSAKFVRDYIIKKFGFEGLPKASGAMGLMLMAGRMLSSKGGGGLIGSGGGKAAETAASATAKAEEMGAMGKALDNSDRAISDLKEPELSHSYGERADGGKTDEFLRKDAESAEEDVRTEDVEGAEDVGTDGEDAGTDTGEADTGDAGDESEVVPEPTDLDAPPETEVVEDADVETLPAPEGAEGESGEGGKPLGKEPEGADDKKADGVEIDGTEKDGAIPKGSDDGAEGDIRSDKKADLGGVPGAEGGESKKPDAPKPIGEDKVAASKKADLKDVPGEGRTVSVPRPKPISEGSTEGKFVEGLSDRDRKRYDNLRKMDAVESQIAKNNDYINSVGYSAGAYQKAMQTQTELGNQVKRLQEQRSALDSRADADKARMDNDILNAAQAKERSDKRLEELSGSSKPKDKEAYAAELEKNDSISKQIKSLEARKESYDAHQKVEARNLDNEIKRMQDAQTANEQRVQTMRKAHELSQDNAFYGKHLDYHKKVESVYAENSAAAGMDKTYYRDADSFRRQKQIEAAKKEHMTLGNFESRSYDGILSPQEKEKIYRQRATQLASQERIARVTKVAGIAVGTIGAIGGMYGGPNGMMTGAMLGSGAVNLAGGALGKTSTEQKVMGSSRREEETSKVPEVKKKEHVRTDREAMGIKERAVASTDKEKRVREAVERGAIKTERTTIDGMSKTAEDAAERIKNDKK